MKKYFFMTMLGIGIAGFTNSAKAQEIELMKEQKEVLELNTDLIEKKIELQKEMLDNIKIRETVDELNRKSDKKTDQFDISTPKATAKEAKNTAKILRKTESANHDLYKSNRKVADIEEDIRRIEAKLERLQYDVNFVKK